MHSVNVLFHFYVYEDKKAEKAAISKSANRTSSAKSAELAKVEKLLAKQTKRAHHFESMADERQSMINEFKEKVTILIDGKDQAVMASKAARARLDRVSVRTSRYKRS